MLSVAGGNALPTFCAEELRDGASGEQRASRVAEPWDRLVGGETMDLLLCEHRTRANVTEAKAAVAHFSPSCKTLTRIREVPIPGAKFSPPPVRSAEFPRGLQALRRPNWAGLAVRVENDNNLADWALERCIRRAKAGLGFTLENPWGSYLWMFELARELAKLPGVRMVKLHNCRFFDGRKRKESCFCTNVEEIAGLIARLCSNRNGICDRTGAGHDSWKPKVAEGKVLEFVSEMEAEFQPELCKCYAQGAAAFIAKLGRDLEWDFVEFFAGPRSPLTRAVKEMVVPHGAAEAIAGLKVWPLRLQHGEGNLRCGGGGSRGEELSEMKGPGIPCSGMVRVGKWKSSLVRAELVRAGPQRAAGTLWSSKPRPTSGKQLREIENSECIGGLRSPWKHHLGDGSRRLVGDLLRKTIQDFVAKDRSIVDDLLTDKESGFLKHARRIEEVLVPELAKALGAENWSVGPRSRWRPGLVEAYIKATGDQEKHLGEWLRYGAPTGVAEEIPTCGIFPKVEKPAEALEDLQRIFARAEAHKNYVSVVTNGEAVEEELDRLTKLGYMSKVDSWKILVEQLPKVVVNKMACIVKEKDDGSIKLRLIFDML